MSKQTKTKTSLYICIIRQKTTHISTFCTYNSEEPNGNAWAIAAITRNQQWIIMHVNSTHFILNTLSIQYLINIFRDFQIYQIPPPIYIQCSPCISKTNTAVKNYLRRFPGNPFTIFSTSIASYNGQMFIVIVKSLKNRKSM